MGGGAVEASIPPSSSHFRPSYRSGYTGFPPFAFAHSSILLAEIQPTTLEMLNVCVCGRTYAKLGTSRWHAIQREWK